MSCQRQVGASLLEVMISMAILAVGLAAIVKFESDIFRHHADMNQHAAALNLAHHKLDELRHYVVIDTTPGKIAYNDIGNGSQTVTVGNTTYALTWTVTNKTNPSHKEVIVNVSWTGLKNDSQAVSLSGKIAPVDPALSGKIMQGS